MVCIAEGLKGSDNGGFTRVNAHWVNVLHRAHDGCIVGFITHDFVLQFLPSQNRFFDQHLRNTRITKAELRDFNQFTHVSCRSTTKTSKGERGTNQNGPTANGFSGCDDFIDGVASNSLADGQVDGFTDLVEQFTVFGFVNGLEV